jgi:hypothetical protein
MKKIFAMNMGQGASGRFDGAAFVTKRIPDELYLKSEEIARGLTELESEKKPSRALSFIKFFTLTVGLVFLWAIIGALSADGGFIENLKTGFSNAPYIFILCPIFILISISLFLRGKKTTEVEIPSERLEEFRKKEAELSSEIKRFLGIPDTAERLDVLCYPYKITKNGEVQPFNNYATHVPTEMYVFTDTESLYIASNIELYEFPKSAFSGVRQADIKIKLLCWNKDEPLDSEGYAEYGMYYDNYGVVIANGFSALKFLLDGELVEIDLPNYELSKFTELIK